MKKTSQLFTALAVAASLSLFGCKEGHDHHDHDHDHDHDHGEHSKSAAPSGTNQVSNATPYPLDTCLVEDSKLGSMGEPYVFVHEGREIKFCCEGCLPEFKKEPAKYLAKLTVAED